MKSYLLAVMVILVATQGVSALWCHTCVDNRPWPEINGTAEQRGPLSLCRRGVEPSFLFLRKCQSETEVCGQLFYDGNLNGFYTRYALRGCIEPEALPALGDYQYEINKCDGFSFDLTPVMPLGPGTVEYCLCDEDKCNPIQNTNGTLVTGSRKEASDLLNFMKYFKR